MILGTVRIFVYPAALLASGCFLVVIDLTVEEDGAGTFHSQMDLDPHFLEFADQVLS